MTKRTRPGGSRRTSLSCRSCCVERNADQFDVRYWGQSGRCTDLSPRALLTQSGHGLAPTCPLPTSQSDPLRSVPPGLGGAMRRREFIALIGSATAAWPLTARARQPVMPLITASASTTGHLIAAFRQGLAAGGYE